MIKKRTQSIEEEGMKKGVHIICVGCKTQRVMTFKEADELKPGETVACKECGNVMVLQKVVWANEKDRD